jgi:hypothetical protein
MNRTTLLALAAAPAWLSIASLRADPVTHQVNFPSGDAAWTVKFDQDGATSGDSAGLAPAAKAAAGKKMREIDIVRTGHVRRDEITFVDGTTQERWWVENPDYALFQNGALVSSIRAANCAALRFDASSLNFVSAATYKGNKTEQGIECQYYEYKVGDNLQGWTTNGPLVRAWIDAKNHQPVAYDNGTGIGVFGFSRGAVPDIKMPPDFQKKYEQLVAFFAPPRKNP